MYLVIILHKCFEKSDSSSNISYSHHRHLVARHRLVVILHHLLRGVEAPVSEHLAANFPDAWQ